MPDIVPIHAFFGEDMEPNLAADTRQALHEADLIFGVDWMTQEGVLVFGRHTMEEMIRSGQERTVRVLRIGVDQETEELERLVALVRVVKGWDDYSGSKEG
jgi:hypothetical protein